MSAVDFNYYNSDHLKFMEPLGKWRILDLKGLRELGEYPNHASVFRKTVSRLEKARIIQSFIDPWSKRKFVYLTEMGEKLFNGEDSPITIHNETRLHDARVIELVRILLKYDLFTDVELEHEYHGFSAHLRPDAILKAKVAKKDINVALEVELTGKSDSRVYDKIEYYLNTKYFSNVIYFFCNETLCKRYQRKIFELFGREAFEKIILIWNPSLLTGKINMSRGGGYYKNKEKSIHEILSKK